MKTNTISSDAVSLIQLKDGENVRETLADAVDRPDVARARAFVEPLINGFALSTGEDTLAHADAVVQILKELDGSESLQTAAYLVYAIEHIQRPKEVIEKAFGSSMANLVIDTHRLIQVQHSARQNAVVNDNDAMAQTERARKMLLAFSRDLRGVMLRLASRLQTMRYCATHRVELPKSMAEETLNVFAPLASRLGIWQIKWELEDLAFRFIQPETYQQIAKLLDEPRIERENYIAHVEKYLIVSLKELGIDAKVTGRPKHIYSIWKKMHGKSLDFDQVYDLRAFRIIVPSVQDCYTVLAWINAHFEQIPSEFDDYIAKPKVNGYQSLHTVVKDTSEAGRGKCLEIQIRTQDMHDRAENGVAAHWAYKEAGSKGYSGVVANSDYDARIAMLRQLLAWERDLSHHATEEGASLFDDRIYVLTPMATFIELPQGSTPLDFAYAVHTDLGHKCRGAKVDGMMVPLDTPLQNGQTVEIVSAKEGGPSRDWLNSDEHYLASPRAKAKVRAWFNAQVTQQTIARGREQVEKLLQREGKTALKLDDLAAKLGFKNADSLFEVIGKDEYSLRNIEQIFKPAVQESPQEALLSASRKPQPASSHKGGVLVVGMDSLLTQLAKCCKPAPPDDIVGYVTRGKGVSIHRSDCTNIKELEQREPERVIEVQWEAPQASENGHLPVYPVDIEVWAVDRQGLLRDISEVLSKEHINVIGVNTQSLRHRLHGDSAWMTFTVEVADTERLKRALNQVSAVSGVRSANRR
jgi:GTP pyrophosphokinase